MVKFVCCCCCCTCTTGWSWIRVGMFWVIYGWTVFPPPMKTFSFLFPQTFVFIHSISNLFLTFITFVLLCLPFSLSEPLRQQTKSYNFSPFVRFRTHCNTAFWGVKLMLHDEKNHVRKDVLVLCISWIKEMTLNVKKIIIWKISKAHCHKSIQTCNFTVGFEQN